MRKSTTVRFLLFHRSANFFDYNTDFAIFDFDWIQKVVLLFVSFCFHYLAVFGFRGFDALPFESLVPTAHIISTLFARD